MTIDTLTDAQQRAILTEYLDYVDGNRTLPPHANFLPYEDIPTVSPSILGSLMADPMIEGELRELTNQVNQWLGNLRAWHAWIDVLSHHPEHIRYQMEWRWVEPLAFRCLFQPSGMRDRIVAVATHALHQVRMSLDPHLPDRLVGDPDKPNVPTKYPTRRQKEAQLAEFVHPWPSGTTFIEAVRKIDGKANRDATADFRNRASHGIAPRFSVGITSEVTRRVVQATRLEEQSDGTFNEVPIGTMSVSYGFGGTNPLDMRASWQTNADQFLLTYNACQLYVRLLREAIDSGRRSDGSPRPA